MAGSERDLVLALRAELAAIDPSRPCDREAERAGLEPAGRRRDPAVARLALRLARRDSATGTPTGTASPLAADALPFDWASRPEHCRMAWLRGRVLAAGSLSVANGRTHLEIVVAPDEAQALTAHLAAAGIPPSWRIRRGRGVVTWKSAETVQVVLRRIGAGASLLELDARQVARTLRGELNRVLNAESANLTRTVAAAGRQLEAIEAVRVDGRLERQPLTVRTVAAARRETPEATLGELADRLAIHRSAVQRALERIERLARAMIRSMRPVIVAGNWKMHTTPADAGALAATIARRTNEPDVVRVLCPPFVCLAAVRDALETETAAGVVAVGAQNVHHETAGAYTGEVSAAMLRGLATWVIVGHSERRRDAAETDALISRKILRAREVGLRVILCVGEQLSEREAGAAASVVRAQVIGSLDGVGGLAPDWLTIAYEPVWAIGTGRNAQGSDAASMAGVIRDALAGLGAANGGEGIPILYGGSVSSTNIDEFMAEPSIDGALVGGASLKPDEMAAIVARAGLTARARAGNLGA